MKMQILSWICLIMCAEAIAFIACHGEVATDMNVKASDKDDQEHSVGVEAVVHERKGAYGGSDLVKKPSNTKSGVSKLPVNTLGAGGITFSVFMLLVLLV
ncbi:hypothetical protein ACS0TY_024347 [Phlomoides rotata]